MTSFSKNLLEIYKEHKDEIDIICDRPLLFILAFVNRIGWVKPDQLKEDLGISNRELWEKLGALLRGGVLEEEDGKIRITSFGRQLLSDLGFIRPPVSLKPAPEERPAPSLKVTDLLGRPLLIGLMVGLVISLSVIGVLEMLVFEPGTPTPTSTVETIYRPSPTRRATVTATSAIRPNIPTYPPTYIPTAVRSTPTATATPTSTPTPTYSPVPIVTVCNPPYGWTLHVVQSGDSLQSLAWHYGIDVQSIVRANCLSSYTLIPGQLLYLPSMPASPTTIWPSPTFTPCRPPWGWQIYIVKYGDSLQSLAWRYGIDVQTIVSANCLTSYNIVPGQQLYLPPWLPTPTSTSTPCGPPVGWYIYAVRPGDTLFSLAQTHHTTVEAIMRANCLTDSNIWVGQWLYLPPKPTATPTATFTITPTPTWTPTTMPPTLTPTETPTVETPTPTLTPTETPTVETPTPTLTPTETPTVEMPTPTETPTLTLTPTETPTVETPTPTETLPAQCDASLVVDFGVDLMACDVFTFTLTVINIGQQGMAQNVTLDLGVISGGEYVASLSPTQWQAGDIPPGQSAGVQVDVVMNPAWSTVQPGMAFSLNAVVSREDCQPGYNVGQSDTVSGIRAAGCLSSTMGYYVAEASTLSLGR